jgi:tRNA-2-methylthio-N6-dimethylallyladenosine synthase
LSTDFIVGFPGETEDDFQASMALIAACGFESAYSFIYSPRPGTPAADLPDDTPAALKLTRLQALQAAIDQNGQALQAAMVGTQQQVLIEGPAKKNPSEWMGRTPNNLVVHIEGHPRLVGQIIPVEITQAYAHTLRGQAL